MSIAYIRSQSLKLFSTGLDLNGARPAAGEEAGDALPPAREGRAGRDTSRMSGRAWLILSLSVIIVAAVFRLFDPALKPLHHDEGVNGLFLMRLFRGGVYRYDPANYHGPTLYYFGLAPALFLGLNTLAIRAVTAAFGVATVWLLLCLRRYVGPAGALAASALVAVSPGAVYFSRYFIHETLFVFFTLGLVVALLRFHDDGRPIYLMLASISAALLFATKETAIISVAVLVMALACARAYFRIRRAAEPDGRDMDERAEKAERFGGRRRFSALLLIALGLFALVFVLFYSSFLTHPKGVTDALKTFEFWARTGTRNHVREWHTYVFWLVDEESPLLALGLLGSALAVWRAPNIFNARFALFAALWAFGLLAAYSLIPYKTPWLALNFIVPMAVACGYALGVIYERNRLAAAMIFCAAISICVYQTISLNFFHYDDDRYVYAYAHTDREFLSMVDEIERTAQAAGTGLDTRIAVISPDYWPLPWYLRNYRAVGYYGASRETSEAVVIASDAQELELPEALGNGYQLVGSYRLRPGVTLLLYARNDLIEQSL
ncbi:MAG TPA: flippase activity-associated protein Agl23 [Blastocatellia bacterium]|nr:flippase activity-associated protein Agl23 [Blastocatellia bacterium]